MPAYQAPKGTFDVLPPQSARYERLVAAFADRAERAGYGLVIGPLFEEVGVFERVGEGTDIVRKEMYDFDDKGGRHMALRPESTASVVRAYVQHRPVPPWKVWYVAPHFRYENPQAGRFRQHHSLGAEALGSEDADLDVEMITLAWRFYRDLGVTRLRLDLTSLGDDQCRPAYRQLLIEYLRGQTLCDDHAARLDENPLRVLDCKTPACVAATAGAPFQVDHLCEPCTAHFERVQAGLTALGVPFTLAPRLVRGLDYYTRTTFEFAAEALPATQNAAGGGGRYDKLTEALGGPPTPGIGFGLGIERILLVCDAEGVLPAPASSLDVFVIDTTGGVTANEVADRLRDAGVRTDRAFDSRSFKAQMRQALRSEARLALVIEERGWTLRTLTEQGEPDTVDPSAVVDHVLKRLAS